MGIPFTFFTVGASFGMMSIGNQMFMPESSPTVPVPVPVPVTVTVETKRRTDNTQHQEEQTQNQEHGRLSTRSTQSEEKTPTIFQQWNTLLSDDRMRNITVLNGGYWFVLSGSQMTLMPLMLVGEQFQMSASHIGGVFAAASVISVICTPIAAKILDSIGQVKAVVPACLAIGATMAIVPLAEHDAMAFLGLFFAWTTAGTLLSAGPTAYVSNISTAQDRGQALALLRTGGDVGMLGGAVVSGALAGLLSSQPEAIALNGIGFCILSCFSGIRLWRREQKLDDDVVEKKKKKEKEKKEKEMEMKMKMEKQEQEKEKEKE